MTAHCKSQPTSSSLQPPPRRSLAIMVAVLVCLGFATGGSSQESNLGIAITQLLALPVGLYAAWCLSQDGLPRLAWLGLAAMCLVVLVPLLQLLPLPAAIWHLPAARQTLAHDLQTAGVQDLHYRWSLTPAATLQAVLSLLPALAAFLGVLALDRSAQRGLLVLLVVLGLASLVLGFLQVSGGPDNAFVLFAQWSPSLGGVFANPNHQATMLIIVALLGTGFAVNASRRSRQGSAPAWTPWPWAATAVIALLVIPTTASRAGLILGVLGMAAVLLAQGVVPLRRRSTRLPNLVGLLAIGALVVIGMAASRLWMHADALGDVRPLLAHATWTLGWQHAPLGSGIGSFVQVFAQEAPNRFLQQEYINHAHNEYVQWWLEGGVLALFALGAVLCVLAIAALRLLRATLTERALSMPALVAIAIILAHSWVDYPLRTPALMLVAAVLAGVVIATAARTSPESRGDEQPDERGKGGRRSRQPA